MTKNDMEDVRVKFPKDSELARLLNAAQALRGGPEVMSKATLLKEAGVMYYRGLLALPEQALPAVSGSPVPEKPDKYRAIADYDPEDDI
jgi:hypothetical protein